jgi:alkanesulfonate monooxygenase SsuD/methylene tetrahydromethanopterin reductase-like flavin-dependent oxidoreductase (luciferase family)
MEQAESELYDFLGRRGLDVGAMDEETKRSILGRFTFGDPDTVGERLEEDLALGVDGFTVNMPANGHIPERVSLLGSTVAPLINR